MSFRPRSPSREILVLKEDREDDASATQPGSDPTYVESSGDDGPRVICRRVRKGVEDRPNTPVPGEYHSSRARSGRQHHDPLGIGSERPVVRRPIKASSKGNSNPKKSSSGVAASKPVMKNDLKAKKAVIREIEGLWGRGFIKAYIPKCHRPLTKRGDSKRSAFRKHETDPINWLPSVLKAILMIAKLTDDKEWLKKAMNDVVRYRIKHTGNRKPQLVTTDFSVIEDMLIKDWKVSFAFEIRYKHILFQRREDEVDDEVIDRIMDAGSDDDEEDSNHDEDDDPPETDEEEGSVVKDVSTKYRQSSSRKKVRQDASPIPSRRQSKQERHEVTKESDSPPTTVSSSQPPDGYSHGAAMPGYGQLFDSWGRPMPAFWGPHVHNGHVGFGGYGGYGDYVSPPQFRGAQQGTQPPAHGLPYFPPLPQSMVPTSSVPEPYYNQDRGDHKKRKRETSSTASKRARLSDTTSPSPDTQGDLSANINQDTPIKREPPSDEDWCFIDDWAVSTEGSGERDEEEEVDEDDVIDAEVEAMELELKLAQLKAARLRARCKKKP